MMARNWRPDGQFSLPQTLAPFRRGKGDPTWFLAPDQAIWRGIRSPIGATTVRLKQDAGLVLAQAWGAGAEWVLSQLPIALGAGDQPEHFRPQHPVLTELARRHPGLRLGASGLVLEALIPAIIEQKVTGREAFAAQARLVRRHGEPAPGPGADLGLWVPPDPETLSGLTSWQWAELGITPLRVQTLHRVLSHRNRLADSGALTSAELDQLLRQVPGVGVWTSAETRARVLGDPDAISFGDYHVGRNIGWALVGEPLDDEALEQVLRPYEGQRYRVQRLVELGGFRPPRRGPRRSLPRHLPGM